MAAFSEATVRAAYEACHKNGVAQGTVGIVSTLAIFFMVYKMVDIWTKNSKQDNFDRKMYFDLIKQYVLYMAFIISFPFILGAIETSLANMQDSISSKYSSSLNSSTEQAISDFIQKYQEEMAASDPSYQDSSTLDKMVEAIKEVNPITAFIEYVKSAWMGMTMELYLACLWVLKYVYFFFCAGRYLWLLMLEVLAPIALICTLNPKTFTFFTSWLRNMVVCYLLIPFFLIADAFSETLSSQLVASFDLSSYGMFWVIGIIIIKISMFGVVTKRAHSLI